MTTKQLIEDAGLTSPEARYWEIYEELTAAAKEILEGGK